MFLLLLEWAIRPSQRFSFLPLPWDFSNSPRQRRRVRKLSAKITRCCAQLSPTRCFSAVQYWTWQKSLTSTTRIPNPWADHFQPSSATMKMASFSCRVTSINSVQSHCDYSIPQSHFGIPIVSSNLNRNEVFTRPSRTLDKCCLCSLYSRLSSYNRIWRRSRTQCTVRRIPSEPR